MASNSRAGTAQTFARSVVWRNQNGPSLPRSSQSPANSGFGGGDSLCLSVYAMGTSGVIGGVVRVFGINWLFGAAHRGELPQQRPGPHNLGAERLHPSAQLRVGGVDQRRRPIRLFVYQFHDSVIRFTPAAMSGVDHGEERGRRQHGGWLLPIEHDRPFATVAERQRNDLGDEPSRGLSRIAPPAVRPRAHDVVAADEHSELRRLGHAVLRSRSCREVFPETERRPVPCEDAMILGAGV